MPSNQRLPVAVSFEVDGITTDPDPLNDSASVTIPLGVGEGVAVHALQRRYFLLLALLIGALGAGTVLRPK